MKILDVGGGFAGNGIGEDLHNVLKITEKDMINEDWEILAEPGRYVASTLFSMGVRVIGKRMISDTYMALYINDGIYHAFNKVSTDGVTLNGQRLFFNGEKAKVTAIKCIIFGHTCDGLDVVARDVYVPNDIEIGDWFVFAGMGAYTNGIKSYFNSMESTNKVFVLEEKVIKEVSEEAKEEDVKVVEEDDDDDVTKTVGKIQLEKTCSMDCKIEYNYDLHESD